ncbi:uncharacterized protein LOC122932005 [Bufo gargarizans]|uniref:uncharacterized protein LOC122932005 n=1 Tax=Bufo gargarizans TaxID=30331 RepID=UPI001CF3A39E|nr:uncharacterized protein LOC122932005 [Bufo gargarizans]
MEEGASGPGSTGQGRSPNSAGDSLSTTTISSGSFLTSEKTDSSPGNSAPEVAFDVTASDNHLSYTFHSLDPKHDFDISISSCARSDATGSPQNMQDRSQSSSNTRGSPAVTHSTPALSSSVGLFHSLNIRRSSPRRQNEADFSGSFLPLHPECTHNEPNLRRRGDSGQEQDQETPFQHGVLQRLMMPVTDLSLVGTSLPS